MPRLKIVLTSKEETLLIFWKTLKDCPRRYRRQSVIMAEGISITQCFGRRCALALRVNFQLPRQRQKSPRRSSRNLEVLTSLKTSLPRLPLTALVAVGRGSSKIVLEILRYIRLRIRTVR